MKRILSGFIAIFAIAMIMTACTKTTSPVNDTRVFGFNLTVAPNEWAQNTQNPRIFNSGQDVNLINQNIRDYGAVLVYFSTNPNSFEDAGALPFGNYTFYSAHESGVVHFTAEYTVDGTPVKPNYPVYVKIVVIPATDTQKISNMHDKSYNAVKAAFNIQD